MLSLEVPQIIENEKESVRELLFKSALERAYILKDELWKGLSIRIYGGAMADQKDKLGFLISKGFVNNDAVLVMKTKSISNYIEKVPSQCTVKKNLLQSDEEQKAFIDRHNGIFPTELDNDKMAYFIQQNNWAVFSMYKNEKIIGECMVFEKDSIGYIEMFYILPEMRGTGVADALINNAFNFLSGGYIQVV